MNRILIFLILFAAPVYGQGNVRISEPIGPKTKAKSVSVTHATDDAVPLPSGAATAAKQDTQITAEQAILAKLIASPATAAKQDTGNASVATTATNTTSAQRTPAITTVSADGSVTAGARKVTFIFSPDFAGTVLTATFAGPADTSITLAAPWNDTLAAIAYTRSAGSIRIVEIR